MFDKKIEFEDMKSAETVVGVSVKLKGTLKSEGNITVNGSVAGDIRTKEDVFIGGSAEIKANVIAKNATVSGIIQGNIKVASELKITETGKVLGDIEAKILNIAPGAVFSGRSIMSDLPIEEISYDPEEVLLEEATLNIEE